MHVVWWTFGWAFPVVSDDGSAGFFGRWMEWVVAEFVGWEWAEGAVEGDL